MARCEDDRIATTRRVERALRVHSRFRLAIGVASALCVAAFTPSAFAQDRERDAPIGGGRGHAYHPSPQNFAGELRVGLFNPAVDSDPAFANCTSTISCSPYKTIFGTAPRVLISAELDWQALRIPDFGTIGPGVGVGYASISDPAPLASGLGPSGEDTTLQIIPFDLVAVVRADVLYRSLHVPLVPYVKAGLGYALWRTSNTLGTSHFNGVAGSGGSLGTHVAVGIALSLNPFDQYAARGFDDALGVNSTYVFGEWTREDLDGLGIQHHPLRVGGTSWTFGFTFEF
jgi:hypothetical protein